ncbi:hypothetical protein CQA49_00905 [Helicobacter sp. MIT 00-7814]|uniref:TraU family protein n=1 Tax=unclassified Helicobacter TaxID=2593540 RepID=UPI000E1EBBE7|nr:MULTISPECIES: TraU family protein [unclassified Helicobacter]RDU55072.1 hypothetical protein CQA37_04495 [Helicobacter sp. MIT 99-10781]RDU56891.1 hypothetical protein CQA49_00905 [Helicobacter sp. MIT 00-7814]
MRNKLCVLLFSLGTLAFAAQDSSGSSSGDTSGQLSDHKGSKSPMLDFMSSVDWEFFYDKFSITFNLCSCAGSSSDLPLGTKASLVEPLIGFSASNKPMHLVGLGMELESDVLSKRGTSRDGNESNHDQASFRQSNIVTFPILAVVASFLPDIICFDRTSEITSSWLSDVDPIYNNDILSNSTNGKKPTTRTIFNNPVADVACLADCAAATAGYPMNSLYFCDGCRGNMGGHDTGWTKMGDPIENSEIIALKQLALQHETFRLLKTSNASFTYTGGNSLPSTMCGDKIFPMLIKSQYYIQLAYGDAKSFGAMRFHYEFKSSPEDQDAHFFWIWRKRDFCMGQTKC